MAAKGKPVQIPKQISKKDKEEIRVLFAPLKSLLD